MTRHSEESHQKPDTQSASGSVEARRRRLLTAAASSPLLLTIASRPAWAKNGECTASAMASANASGSQEVVGCSISAGWWKNKKHQWPIEHWTPFHSIFREVRYKGNILYYGHSLGDVIDLNGGQDPVQGTFGFHLIGGYLNALMFPPDQGGSGYAFTAQQIVEAYNALHGADTRVGTSTTNGSGKPGKSRGKEEYSPADGMFQALASTLESANNQYDSVTGKPEL